MFGKIFVGELRKLIKPKTAIIFGAIAVFLILVLTIVFSIDLDKIFGQVYGEGENGDIAATSIVLTEGDMEDGLNSDQERLADMANTVIVVDRENYDFVLAQWRQQLNDSIKAANKNKYGYYTGLLFESSLLGGDEIYHAKAMVNIYEYVGEHEELFGKKLYVYSAGSDSTFLAGLIDKTRSNYINSMTATLSILAIIYGIIIASGAYAKEMKSGTLKLVFLRPVSRNKLTLAKLLASLTAASGLYTAMFIVIMIIGLIGFKEPSRTILFVFNAKNIYTGSAALGVFYTYLLTLVSVLSYTTLAFAIGTLTRIRALGIILPLPYTISFISIIAKYICVGRFWIGSAITLSNYFSLGEGLPGGSNFFISLAMLVVYVGGLLALSFLTFNKKDVA